MANPRASMNSGLVSILDVWFGITMTEFWIYFVSMAPVVMMIRLVKKEVCNH